MLQKNAVDGEGLRRYGTEGQTAFPPPSAGLAYPPRGEILDPENLEHARTAGADEVIETTHLGFSLIAHAAVIPGSGTIMSQVASAEAHSLYTTPNPHADTVLYGRLSRDLRAHNATVLGLRLPSTGQVILNPDDGLVVDPECEVVYLAREPVEFTEED